MAQINVSTEEARIIAVWRAITRFDAPEIIWRSDIGDAVDALEATTDLVKLEASDIDMDVFLDGFIAGLGATRLSQLSEYLEQGQPQVAYPPELDSETISGGPTGGVVGGQGNNPDYVTQTGKA